MRVMRIGEKIRTLNVYAKNLNDAINLVYEAVINNGHSAKPRGKEVLEWPTPVVISLEEHSHPWTFIPGRKLNPYFAVAEVIWILAGREDVEFISYYNKNISMFSDDGKTFHGAYGDRLRNFPEYGREPDSEPGNYESYYKDYIDQIKLAVYRLGKDKYSRQAVLCLWDPARDLKDGHKDYPCNNLCYFTLRDNKLHMSVVRRSNDMIWGLPYNQIQFYFLQALMAGSLGAEMGEYYEFIQNMHVYTEQYKDLFDLVAQRCSSGYVRLTELMTPENVGLNLDRRIGLAVFEDFAKLFFEAEKQWRTKPETFDTKAYHEVVVAMRAKGVPAYWVENMLALPAAYIARKQEKFELCYGILARVESGLNWLINDFHSPYKNGAEQ